MPHKGSHPTLETKQEALKNLRSRREVTFLAPHVNPNSNFGCKVVEIANHSGVSNAAFFGWKNNSAKILSI